MKEPKYGPLDPELIKDGTDLLLRHEADFLVFGGRDQPAVKVIEVVKDELDAAHYALVRAGIESAETVRAEHKKTRLSNAIKRRAARRQISQDAVDSQG